MALASLLDLAAQVLFELFDPIGEGLRMDADVLGCADDGGLVRSGGVLGGLFG
ncbi:hypothetical protein ACLMAL_17960 [Nocardia sp. CWNU-33]|uniref:hypothetical protein n=1 Tax=Nocardia sp. CWNU-33 TaxID=3392117 RepID=UPI00398E39D5